MGYGDPKQNELLEALKLLLETYVKMNNMAACETGQKSHALWHSTAFIQREIKEMTKLIKLRGEL